MSAIAVELVYLARNGEHRREYAGAHGSQPSSKGQAADRRREEMTAF
jgi:hypothetical protein